MQCSVELYIECNCKPYMWRHQRKRTLLRKKYRRSWSDAAHDARRLIRAYDIFCSWASKENIFIALYEVLIKNAIAKVWKQLIYDDTVCSAIRSLFPDDVTNWLWYKCSSWCIFCLFFNIWHLILRKRFIFVSDSSHISHKTCSFFGRHFHKESIS